MGQDRKVCTMPSCIDGQKGAGESDVDCGGACPACADGLACGAASDCRSGVCAGGKCAAPTCADGVRNGRESDVDCGGGCPPCKLGRACAKAEDCRQDPKSSLDCCGGACVDTAADPAHCAGCGKACMNGGACCASACVDLASDLAHCGGCAMACAPANAVPACAASQCSVASCRAGFGDCNQSPGDGCEVATATDPMHCGGCGKACSNAHGTPSCAMGACAIACDMGYADCDADPANGCEVDLATDLAHCGGCGKACPGQNGTPSCAMGACALACAMGFGDCNGNKADGCEANLVTDKAHCGMCGKACAQGQSCMAGVCQGGMPGLPAYDPAVAFKDALGGTTMTIAWDGTSYWSCSGGGPGGVRLARYDAAGMMVGTFSPGIDFRSVYTKGDAPPLYAREYSSRVLRQMMAPGMFAAGASLMGGTLDAQSSVTFNEDGSELIALNGPTVSRWSPAGAFLGSVTLAGFGGMNSENTYPQNRGVVKAGGFYLTYSNRVLSMWDPAGTRVRTTTLTGAGTSFDAHFSLSYANKKVWIVDAAGGQWRGYDVGLQ